MCLLDELKTNKDKDDDDDDPECGISDSSGCSDSNEWKPADWRLFSRNAAARSPDWTISRNSLVETVNQNLLGLVS